jgi:hypothetical protein
LIADFVKGRKSGICSLSVEANTEGWELHLKLAFPERELSISSSPHTKSLAPSTMTTARESGGASNESSKRLSNQDVGGEDSTSSSMSSAAAKITGTLGGFINTSATPGVAGGESLLPDYDTCSGSEESTSFERLADRVIGKHLSTRPTTMLNEVKEGVVRCHKVLQLGRDFCTVAEKSTNAAVQSGHRTNNAEHSDRTRQQQWLLVTSKPQEAGILAAFKDKLVALYVPVQMVPLQELKQYASTLSNRNVAVVLESHLSKLRDYDPVIKAASQIIVVVDLTYAIGNYSHQGKLRFISVY